MKYYLYVHGGVKASHILRQVVEGLKYLHSHYILHRDMTLSNLLLTKDMTVVINNGRFYFVVKK